MVKTRYFFFASVAAVILGFFFWAIYSPKNDIHEVIARKLESESTKSDVAFNIVTFSEVSDGIKYWQLNAASSTINKTTGIAYLSIVDGVFYRDGQPTLKFLAPKAVWQMNKKEISLIEPFGYDVRSEQELKEEIKKIGGVKRLFSYFSLPSEKPESKSKGYWFKSKRLEWKLSTKKLYCEGGIMLTKGDITIKAKNLEADTGLEKVMLTGETSAMLYSEKDRSRINITATSFLVDSKIDMVYAYDNVGIKSKSASIYSINAIYDQKDKKIALIEGVILSSKDINAWSDFATYSLSDYIAELSGNARATKGESELQGEKIIVLTEEGRLFVLGRSKAKIHESEIEKLQ